MRELMDMLTRALDLPRTRACESHTRIGDFYASTQRCAGGTISKTRFEAAKSHLTRAKTTASDLDLLAFMRVQLSLARLESTCGSVVRGARIRQACHRLVEARRRLSEGDAQPGVCLCGTSVGGGKTGGGGGGGCEACGDVWTGFVGELRALLK